MLALHVDEGRPARRRRVIHLELPGVRRRRDGAPCGADGVVQVSIFFLDGNLGIEGMDHVQMTWCAHAGERASTS